MLATLCIFAKAPETGRVKTRLAATIGDEAALRVYQELLTVTGAVARVWPGPVLVLGTGDEQALAASPLGAFERQAQVAGGLGARLRAGLASALASNDTAIAIGTDCPFLDLAALQAIDDLLGNHDVAFGPAADGGYWSLGVSRASDLPVVCADDLPWSQADLLTASEQACIAARLTIARGGELADLDDADDLDLARRQGFISPLPLG